MNNPVRSRIQYSGVAVCVVALGLLSRTKIAASLPKFVADYSGDFLWALLVYVLMAIASPKSKPIVVAARAAAFALSIELSQLFQADWANQIRDAPGMRLVFGYGFLWSDLACYGVGIAFGWMIEHQTMVSRHKQA